MTATAGATGATATAGATGAAAATIGPGPVRRRLGGLGRAALWWFVLVAASVLLVVIAGTPARDTYLDPEGHGRQGIGALVAVLEQQGVRVHTVSTIEDLRTAVDAVPDRKVTVAVGPTTFVTPDGARQVHFSVERTSRLVLLDGGAPVLPSLTPDLQALSVNGGGDPLEARCDSPLARDAAQLTLIAVRFIAHDTEEGVRTCYPLPSSDGVDHGSALAVIPAVGDRPETYAVGFGPALTNQHVAEEGHAALGLRLLGSQPDLIVYTPSLADVFVTAGTPREEVEPPGWLLPALVVVGLAVIVYAVAAGRRLGRLVPEPLPVVVRASETTHSRGELYRAAQDRERAAATLRLGTLSRLRARLRLSPTATPVEVVQALASHGIPESASAPMLAGPDPADDDALVALARDLTILETKVTPR